MKQKYNRMLPMKTLASCRNIAVVIYVAFWFQPALAVSFITVTSPQAKIYKEADINSPTVATAIQRDVFELIEERDDFYSIDLFSGQPRYILKSDSEITEYAMNSIEDKKLLLKLVEKIRQIEINAKNEADKKYPLMDSQGERLEANSTNHKDLMMASIDKAAVNLAHEYKIQVGAFGLIIAQNMESEIGNNSND